ncbi:MAG: DnaJ domain-containing protein [Gammaproteobacteria bacterium]|nr:DnaJ domain-containing protein [Gammaproteobacteria bacterium]MBT7370577.1 DnaJ domain-containing protein [Gammaproteobacteria bacterium]
MYVALRGILAKKNLSVQQFFAVYMATLLGMGLLFLGLTGRLHPVAAVIGAALPFVTRLMALVTRGAQFAAMLKFLRNMGIGPSPQGANAPSTSEISSKYIHMVLFHDTGMMDGTVLAGSFKDAKLSQLEADQLRDLLTQIQDDADSCNLLVAYLDREHDGWQSGAQSRPPPLTDGGMDERQALDILGLDESATDKEIVQAHRRLMQKMHPDRGGSTYLAAKINAAKELLLQKRDNGDG